MTGHLIHIGYPKTGSNFLRRWFSGHPQLGYVEGGIAGFCDVYDIARQGADPHAQVLYRVTSSESLVTPHSDVGSDVVDYGRVRQLPAARARVCASLAELFPGAHVLLITRGFRSMFLSSYSQYARSGGEDALSGILERARGEGPWDYDTVITLYRRAFGEKRVIVMPYELLRDDANAFTRALEERLGLTPFDPPRERVNTSLSPVEMYWYPRINRFVRSLRPGQRLHRLYLRGAFANRFRRPIALLQLLRPGGSVTRETIPDEVVDAYRGKAQLLRRNPLYDTYTRDYLL